jgi:UDP-2,3-diacylglucosamine pyrophosphatase LpxH
VILGGDFDNLYLYSKDSDLPEYQFSEARIASFIKSLEYFCAPIYYVPGNHDPAGMFFKNGQEESDKSYSFTDTSFNCHKRIYNIGKNLWILGLGGCCPASRFDRKTKTSEKVWLGFPYETDEDSKYDVEKLDNLIVN